MSEEWRPITGFEGLYEVSNLGRVRSLDRQVNNQGTYIISGKVLVLTADKRGYKHLLLWKDGKSKLGLVHRLVAGAFIPNPCNLPQVNHKDENKGNNIVSNLEWCTAKYNSNYGTGARRNGMARRNNSRDSKPVIQLDLNHNFVAEYPSAREAARRNDFRQSEISKCCRGEIKTSKGFIWLYKN